MQIRRDLDYVLLATLLAVGCGSAIGSTNSAQTTPAHASETTFVSKWTSPTAQPLTQQGRKVAAAVIISDMASRRAAEDALAKEISMHGYTGVPMYSLVEPANVVGEPIARDALEKADVSGVVVLHPSPTETEVVAQDYTRAPYTSYWDGYYSYGISTPYVSSPASQPFVKVETLIYSLIQNQLVWVGQSKTTNPSTLDKLIGEVIGATVKELTEARLLPR